MCKTCYLHGIICLVAEAMQQQDIHLLRMVVGLGGVGEASNWMASWYIGPDLWSSIGSRSWKGYKKLDSCTVSFLINFNLMTCEL